MQTIPQRRNINNNSEGKDMTVEICRHILSLIPKHLFTAFENECVITKNNHPVYHIQGEKANAYLMKILNPSQFVEYVREGRSPHLEYVAKKPYICIDTLAQCAKKASQKLLSTTKDLGFTLIADGHTCPHPERGSVCSVDEGYYKRLSDMCNSHPNDRYFARHGLSSGLHPHHSFDIKNILQSDFFVFFIEYAVALHISYQMTEKQKWYEEYGGTESRINSRGTFSRYRYENRNQLGDAKISRNPQEPLLDYKEEKEKLSNSNNVTKHILDTVLNLYFEPKNHEAMRQRLSGIHSQYTISLIKNLFRAEIKSPGDYPGLTFEHRVGDAFPVTSTKEEIKQRFSGNIGNIEQALLFLIEHLQ